MFDDDFDYEEAYLAVMGEERGEEDEYKSCSCGNGCMCCLDLSYRDFF